MKKKTTIRREVVGETWPPPPCGELPAESSIMIQAKRETLKTRRGK